jgi:hypothetical protein
MQSRLLQKRALFLSRRLYENEHGEAVLEANGQNKKNYLARAVTRFYYHLKPAIPRSLRYRFRRFSARRKLSRTRDVWPISKTAAVPPKGWAGWPEGKRFAVVLTHDVESQVGLDRTPDLVNLEQALGFRSLFNFIPEGEYRVSRELREELVQRGFEIGVHDLKHDGKLFHSRRGFQKRALHINRYLKEWDAVGFRSGFMLNELEWLHDLEIQYDASTFDTDPFEPQPHGANTIFPFWVSDTVGREGRMAAGRVERVERGYVELPYTLPQDSTLFLVFQELSDAIWRQKLDWVAAQGGMVLMNTHPDYMKFEGVPGVAEFNASIYAEFLSYLNSRYKGAFWHALPREVASWVRPVRSQGTK